MILTAGDSIPFLSISDSQMSMFANINSIAF